MNVAQYNAGMDSFEVVELPVLRMIPLALDPQERTQTASLMLTP